MEVGKPYATESSTKSTQLDEILGSLKSSLSDSHTLHIMACETSSKLFGPTVDGEDTEKGISPYGIIEELQLALKQLRVSHEAIAHELNRIKTAI